MLMSLSQFSLFVCLCISYFYHCCDQGLDRYKGFTLAYDFRGCGRAEQVRSGGLGSRERWAAGVGLALPVPLFIFWVSQSMG